ncbi:histone RNA hairpin-binding protein [Anopheles aquasalis]|uniref:histone RNA hairpin-binding protein n=1 Tax=Anopheles aquasalis TaxID=42839 RepID=UPI00215AD1F6|nr:histone RNA hairpin-binding protein [Anopheles aquasalis]
MALLQKDIQRKDDKEVGLKDSKHDKSWYDITMEEEEQMSKAAERESRTKFGSQKSRKVTATTASSSDSDESSTGMSNRQIEIDFLDSANVKKYKKLVESEQIKSPFKRRHSGEASSDGTDEDNVEIATNKDGFGADYPPNHRGSRYFDRHTMYSKKSKKHKDDRGNGGFRWRTESSSSSGASSQNSGRRQIQEYETDEAVLVRRQKQIDYGKNTLGYTNYIEQVPRDERTKDHPRTPPKHVKYSRRGWDALVKTWRKKLHCFDPNSASENYNE